MRGNLNSRTRAALICHTVFIDFVCKVDARMLLLALFSRLFFSSSFFFFWRNGISPFLLLHGDWPREKNSA
jgi:hypothetical protein